MISTPILYSFRRCPYAIRARLALQYAGIAAAVREVSLRHKPAELLRLSPKGTVPVLQLSDGTVLEESLDIMRWALTQPHPARVSPAQPDVLRDRMDCATGRALIALNDGAFKRLLDSYKYAGNQSVCPAENYRDEAVDLFVAPLNRRLCHSRYLLGKTLTLADMAIVPFIRQFASVDPDWFAAAPVPALRHWLSALTQSALFVSIMPKRAPWQPGDPPTML